MVQLAAIPEGFEPVPVTSVSGDWEPLGGGPHEDEKVRVEALKQGLSPEKAELAVALHHSEYDPKNFTSKAGAIGWMQLMPGTAKAEGVDPFNVDDNIKGGVSYFKKQLDRFGTPELALAAYNAGPEAVRKHGGVPPYSETREYVRKTMGRWRKSLSGEKPTVPEGWEAVDETALNAVPEGWEEYSIPESPDKLTSPGITPTDESNPLDFFPATSGRAAPNQAQPEPQKDWFWDTFNQPFTIPGVGKDAYLAPYAEKVKQYVESPDDWQGAGEWFAKQLPKSAARLAVGVSRMPGDIAYDVENEGLTAGAEKFAKGTAAFIGAPLGVDSEKQTWTWDKFKDAWVNRPVESLAAIFPFATAFLRVKGGVENPTAEQAKVLVDDAVANPETPFAQEIVGKLDEINAAREEAGTGRGSQVEVAPGEFKTQGEIDLGMVESMRRELEAERAATPSETVTRPGPEWEAVKPGEITKENPDLAAKLEAATERKAIQEEGQSDYLWDRPDYEAEKEELKLNYQGRTEFSKTPFSKDLERSTSAPVPSTDIIKVPEGARRSEMIKEMEKALNIPIRTGRFSQRALGIAKLEPGVIRLKTPNDVEVATHELAHFAQPLMGIAENLPKEVQDMAYEGAKNKSQEGFAEFVRYFVTQPEVAMQRAPTFYKFFEGKLAMYPDVGDIFIKTREAWQQYQAAPSVAKVMSFIQQEAPKGPRMSLDDIYTKMVDELRPVQVLKNIAEKKAGRELRPSEDPFVLAWATRGWARKAEQYLKWGQFQLTDAGMEKVGPSLREILKPVERAGERELLDAYLVAKRASADERITKGFGNILPRSDFEQTVRELEPRFEGVAQQLYAYSDNLLRYLVDAGRISEDAYQAIKQKNLFYAPFYRVMDTDPSVSGLSKRKFADLPEAVKRLKGSARDIYSPTQNIMQNTYALMNLAERSRIGEALIGVSQIEGMGPFIEKLPVKVKSVQMTTQEAIDSAARQMGQSASDFRKALEAEGFNLDDLPEVLQTFRPNYQTKPNEVILYNRGNPEVYQLAPDLYKSLMGLDADSIGALTRLIALPAKILRTGATLSPEFIIRNPVRDQWTAGIYSRYGYLPFYDMMKGIGHILGESDLYEEFNASGAAHAALVSLDRDYLSKNMGELLAGRGGQIKTLVKNPLRMLQAMSELTEEATRVGEFAKALKTESQTPGYSGMDALLKAGTAARDVTLDFSRIGTATKGMNAITAFWNASVQGVDKMVREFRTNPIPALAKTGAAITFPSLALYWAQKDDKYYQEIPTWRRALFWNIVTHNEDGSLKNIWSIPKPFELGILFGTFPEMMLDYMYTKNRSGMDQAFTSFFQAMTPSVMPTALVPIVEWTTNRSWFFDRPTVPRDKEELKPFLQYTPFTTETAKLLARGMSKVPVLRDFASPTKLENLVRGTTGNLGYSSLKVSDAVLKGLNLVDAPTSPAMTLADLPGIKGFIQRMPTENTRSIEEFYKEYGDFKTEYESAKQQAGVRGLGVFGVKGETPQILKEYEATAKVLSVYRHLADMIYENKSMSAQKKRESLDALYNQMIDTTRTALKKK